MIFQRIMNPSSQIPNNEKDLSVVKAKSLFKANPTCFLCNSRLHLAYRCPMTKLIRDKEIQIPLEFCIVHCEKISEKCRDKRCGLFKTPKGKMIDLMCKHKDRHFLLCNKMPCYSISEKYYQKYLNKS